MYILQDIYKPISEVNFSYFATAHKSIDYRSILCRIIISTE